MPVSLKKMAYACWRPIRRNARMNLNSSTSNRDNCDDDSSYEDPLLWGRDLEKHAWGEFSFAVVQANDVIEDHSQVETGSGATFVGVYDGHGGPEASRFIADHLFLHLIRFAQENGAMSVDTLRSAFSATEDGFLTLVRRSCGIKPLIAAMGSCCLVGLIWNGTLHIANVGDSRAVIGYTGRANKIYAEQLTKEHNASMEEVRQELRASHPEDSEIVVMKHGVWRIKGIIQFGWCVLIRVIALRIFLSVVAYKLQASFAQVSRSIGDAYLKRPEFSLDPSFPRFHLSETLRRPVLTAEPSVSSRTLRPNDKFIIFASDGLWEHLTNQKAVEIVHNSPRAGIARRLIKAALYEAARKREMRYDDLKKIEKGARRFFHDDVTVTVIYIDHDVMKSNNISAPELSLRGFTDTAGPSHFSKLQEMK